jgi:hypothetical protein
MIINLKNFLIILFSFSKLEFLMASYSNKKCTNQLQKYQSPEAMIYKKNKKPKKEIKGESDLRKSDLYFLFNKENGDRLTSFINIFNDNLFPKLVNMAKIAEHKELKAFTKQLTDLFLTKLEKSPKVILEKYYEISNKNKYGRIANIEFNKWMKQEARNNQIMTVISKGYPVLAKYKKQQNLNNSNNNNSNNNNNVQKQKNLNNNNNNNNNSNNIINHINLENVNNYEEQSIFKKQNKKSNQINSRYYKESNQINSRYYLDSSEEEEQNDTNNNCDHKVQNSLNFFNNQQENFNFNLNNQQKNFNFNNQHNGEVRK